MNQSIYLQHILSKRLDNRRQGYLVVNKVETLNQNVVFIRSYRCCVFYENTQWSPQLLVPMLFLYSYTVQVDLQVEQTPNLSTIDYSKIVNFI